jgi:Holliday junction DNA helicase RuvA
MIARITGHLEALDVSPIGRAVVGPLGMSDGLAYELWLPAYLAQRLLAEIGSTEPGISTGPVITLFTMQYMEGVNQGSSFVPRLIGFSSLRELEFFDLFTSVKGLGNKRALKALAISPGAVARAITERDTRYLQGLPEIGPKLAELIVHELKNKADAFVNLGSGSTPAPTAASASSANAQIEAKTTKRSKKPSASESGHASGGKTDAPPATPPIRVPIKETVDALMALGESPIDAERMVSRAIDRSRADGKQPPSDAGELLTLAYASR